jgi:hypothetical protein
MLSNLEKKMLLELLPNAMINSGDAVTLVPEYIDEVHKAFSHPIQQI